MESQSTIGVSRPPQNWPGRLTEPWVWPCDSDLGEQWGL